MKAIAVFVKNLTSGGAEKQSVLLAKALAGECDVHYVIFNGMKVHQKYMDMLKIDNRIRVCSFTGGHIGRFKALVDYIKSNDIKAIFSYLTAADFYACMAGRIIGADVYTGLRNAELPFMKLVADRILTNHFAKMAISNSFSGKKHFVSKGFKKDKVVVIPNCFDKISPYVVKTQNDVLKIITVGRFVPQKDYETAIRTIAKLKEMSKKRFSFEIVGYGEQEEQIRKWLKEYKIEDCTSIHINPNNIQELLDNADVYLSTSLFEGTSNSVMEAMNADLPIVATNVGDNCELVEDGKNGFLCDVKDVASLASKLCMLLNDDNLRCEFGKRSKEILSENYSMNVFKDRYLKVLNA